MPAYSRCCFGPESRRLRQAGRCGCWFSTCAHVQLCRPLSGRKASCNLAIARSISLRFALEENLPNILITSLAAGIGIEAVLTFIHFGPKANVEVD